MQYTTESVILVIQLLNLSENSFNPCNKSELKLFIWIKYFKYKRIFLSNVILVCMNETNYGNGQIVINDWTAVRVIVGKGGVNRYGREGRVRKFDISLLAEV